MVTKNIWFWGKERKIKIFKNPDKIYRMNEALVRSLARSFFRLLARLTDRPSRTRTFTFVRSLIAHMFLEMLKKPDVYAGRVFKASPKMKNIVNYQLE